MSHRNARLTVHGRRLLIQRVITDGRPVAHVVQDLGISRATAVPAAIQIPVPGGSPGGGQPRWRRATAVRASVASAVEASVASAVEASVEVAMR